MRKALMIALVLSLLCTLVAPCAAISAPQLAGYWKGTVKMTVRNDLGYPTQQVNDKVKISLAADGTGSYRRDDQFGSTNIGRYWVRANRFTLDAYYEGDDWYPLRFYDMSIKLSGKKLVLKGKMESGEAYSPNAVLTLTRITPQIKRVKADKVPLGYESTLTIGVDTHADFVLMKDMTGRTLASSYDEVSNDTFRIAYSFPGKTNKVRLYAGMKTDDGFVFLSNAKAVTVRCK